METYRELVNRLEERFGSMINVTLEIVPEDIRRYTIVPKYLRDDYRLSKYRMAIYDCVGNRIITLFRYVPKTGGSVVYDRYEVMEKVYAWR